MCWHVSGYEHHSRAPLQPSPLHATTQQRMPSNVLSIPLKVSSLGSSVFSKALRNHIADSFTDTHPDAFTDDLREVGRLRDRVARMDVHLTNIDVALRYVPGWVGSTAC